MQDIAIRVEQLSKCYQIYATPRDRLKQFTLPRLKKLIGHPPKNYFSEFWALRDVSFEVKKGETVGIIGRNGSGKSTLLQMICGTLNPTDGQIQTYGRVAALLELGAGFNPDFTGKENVYLNASVLGLTTEEIDKRFNDILDFSEIGEFIHQPVKTYSSGMMVRLAFAVAINVDPEILIVDEALSVGDERFQRKCFSRIEAIRAKGATILFVSHSGAQIVELCDHAILLDAGEKLAMGTPKKIVGQYQKMLYAPADKCEAIREQIRAYDYRNTIKETESAGAEKSVLTEGQQTAVHAGFDENLKPSSTIDYESNGAYIESPTITTLDFDRVNLLVRGETYLYSYKVKFVSEASLVRFGMMIKTISGVELGGVVSASAINKGVEFINADSSYEISFQFRCALNPGVYFLNAGVVGIVDGKELFLHRLIDIAMFRVMPENEDLATGTVNFSCVPVIKRL